MTANWENMYWSNNITDITWDHPVTRIPDELHEDVIHNHLWHETPEADATYTDPFGWRWEPDSNGNLCCHYDVNDVHCIVWLANEDGSFLWQYGETSYSCRDIGLEGRAGVYDMDRNLVGIMQLNQTLDVQWVDENEESETEEVSQ